MKISKTRQEKWFNALNFEENPRRPSYPKPDTTLDNSARPNCPGSGPSCPGFRTGEAELSGPHINTLFCQENCTIKAYSRTFINFIHNVIVFKTLTHEISANIILSSFGVSLAHCASVKIRYFRDPPLVTDKLSNNIVQKFIWKHIV